MKDCSSKVICFVGLRPISGCYTYGAGFVIQAHETVNRIAENRSELGWKNSSGLPSKSGPVKNLYTKSVRLTDSAEWLGLGL
jgi:hypothetical protein